MSTLPLSLRRSTINVENVVVRLWQSSAICLRAITPAVLFYLLDRHALLAMTMGSKGVFLTALPHPPSHKVRHPPPRTTHANYVCAGPGGRWAFCLVVCWALFHGTRLFEFICSSIISIRYTHRRIHNT